MSAIAATSVMSAQMAVGASEAYTAPTSNVTASELSGSVQLDSLSETVLPTQAELNAPRVLNLEPTQTTYCLLLITVMLVMRVILVIQVTTPVLLVIC